MKNGFFWGTQCHCSSKNKQTRTGGQYGKNGDIRASPTHLFFKIQSHNVVQKWELFLKILGIENEKLVYSEKFEKKWNVPFWPISI